ncbi:MAG: transglutaminase-like domain-containing protein [Nanobdellota archaeon]
MYGILPKSGLLKNVFPPSVHNKIIDSQKITMADSLDREIVLFEADQQAIFIDEVYDTFASNAWHRTRPFSAKPSGNEEISDIVNINFKTNRIDFFAIYNSTIPSQDYTTRLRTEVDPVYTKPIMDIPENVSQALLLYLQNKGLSATSLEDLATEWQEKISSSNQFNYFCDSIASFISSNTYYLNKGYQKEAAPLIAEIENAENRAYKAFENLVGDCEYASTFLSAVLREIGIPTRHVCGWKTKKIAKTNNRHAMTQAFNPYTGWTIFDATADTPMKDEPITDCQCLVERTIYNASKPYDQQKQLPAIKVIECMEDLMAEIRKFDRTDPIHSVLIQAYLEDEFYNHWYEPQTRGTDIEYP